MFKIQVTIYNSGGLTDAKTIISLPSIPRIGETIFLNEKTVKKLESIVKKDTNSWIYYSRWFYGASSGIRDPAKMNMDDLNFDDASIVSYVYYKENSDIVYIELSDCVENN